MSESLVKMMELLERSLKTKEAERDCLKKGYRGDLQRLGEAKKEVDAKTGIVKKMRVGCQRGIADIERKLEAMKVDPEAPTGPLPEDAENVDPDQTLKSA